MLFAIVLLGAVGSSVVYSLSQTPIYQASASVAFQDPSRDLGLAGVGVAPSQTAAQLAASAVPIIEQSNVVEAVKKSLDIDLPQAEVLEAVSATVEPSSTLVQISATSTDARESQRLANAFARQGARAANMEAQERFQDSASELEQARPELCNPPDADEAPTAECDQRQKERALFDELLIRLQTLGAIATPADVTDIARTPEDPISPRPARNALLGGILGLLLGLLAVFLRDSLDRRLRSASEVQEAVDIPVLGHVNDDSMGHSPNPDSVGGVATEDWERLRMVHHNLDFLDSSARSVSVAITSAMPEEGKTTVACSLAFASAAAGKRTLLIECDLRRPVIAERLGIEPAPGLSDFVTANVGPGDVLQLVSFNDPVSQSRSKAGSDGLLTGQTYKHEFACITSGTRTDHPVEVLASARFRTMLGQVSDAYDRVILDTPPMLSVVDPLELLPEVASVVVCVRAGRTTRDQARAGMAALERLPERPTGLVITGVRRADAVTYGYGGY